MDLSNRTAVVTGATAGIGTATAKRARTRPARPSRWSGVARSASKRSPPNSATAPSRYAADVARPDGLADRVHDALGPVDLVVANAGVMLGAPFEQADTAEWQQMLDVNVGGLLPPAARSSTTCSPRRPTGARPTSSTSARSAATSCSRTTASTARPRPRSST